MAKIKRFTVHGFGEFPWDMLRYDACWPETEADSTLMEAHHKERRDITLQTDNASEAANPAAAANATFDAVAAVEGRNVIHTEPREERDHPRIFGTAIWFRGYTCEECIEREWI